MKSSNLTIIEIEEGEKLAQAQKIYSKNIEKIFPNLKNEMVMEIQKAYRTPNRLDQKKSMSPYNNQNTKLTE